MSLIFQRKKRHVIGFFEKEDDEEYRTYVKVASMLRDDCQFHVAVG